AQKDEEIAQKEKEMAQKDEEIAQKEREMAQRDKEKEQIISGAVRLLRQSGLSAEEISVKLSLPLETVQKIYNRD
ncbi:MAG: hypothetical protein K2I27_04705, partial [Bacteroides sp.]|nr:hypothetical protein [Bacteroides sp.]